MLGSTHDRPIASLGDVIPALREGSGLSGRPLAGVPQVISVPVGPPLWVDSTTYKGVAWVAPTDGCWIQDAWLAAAVAVGTGTHTFALENYDKSATSGLNVLSTTNMDPASVTAKEGTQLTLSSTEANLIMDEGDSLNFTAVVGTQGTDGEGYVLSAVIIVPDLDS